MQASFASRPYIFEKIPKTVALGALINLAETRCLKYLYLYLSAKLIMLLRGLYYYLSIKTLGREKGTNYMSPHVPPC